MTEKAFSLSQVLDNKGVRFVLLHFKSDSNNELCTKQQIVLLKTGNRWLKKKKQSVPLFKEVEKTTKVYTIII